MFPHIGDEEVNQPAQSSDLKPIRHFGMNWNANCEPLLDRAEAVASEWSQIATSDPRGLIH